MKVITRPPLSKTPPTALRWSAAQSGLIIATIRQSRPPIEIVSITTWGSLGADGGGGAKVVVLLMGGS